MPAKKNPPDEKKLDESISDVFGADGTTNPPRQGESRYNLMSKAELVQMLEVRDRMDPVETREKRRASVEIPAEGEFDDIAYLRKEGRRILKHLVAVSNVNVKGLYMKIVGRTLSEIDATKFSKAEFDCVLSMKISNHDDANEVEDPRIVDVKVKDVEKSRARVVGMLADLYKMARSEKDVNVLDMDSRRKPPDVYIPRTGRRGGGNGSAKG